MCSVFRIRINSHRHNSPLFGFACSCLARARAVDFPALSACAAPCVSVCSSRPAQLLRSFADVVAADARACDSVHNSARNSRVTGGLLPVCKSTSYFLEVGRQGPTRRKGSKGGVSGPAEDLRHVSEVEAGVNFRPAGGVRGQVAGSLPRR